MMRWLVATGAVGLLAAAFFWRGSARNASPDPSAEQGLLAETDLPSERSLADVVQRVTDGQAVLLDVRSHAERRSTYLKDTHHIPLSDLQDPVQRQVAVQALPRERAIYVHCAKGVRARKGVEILSEMGFSAIVLDVDYAALVTAGFRPGQ